MALFGLGLGGGCQQDVVLGEDYCETRAQLGLPYLFIGVGFHHTGVQLRRISGGPRGQGEVALCYRERCKLKLGLWAIASVDVLWGHRNRCQITTTKPPKGQCVGAQAASHCQPPNP